MNVDAIIETCRAHDLVVTDARLDEGLLQLVPADLGSLPGAAALQRLAETLKSGEVRWVTIVIEEES